MQLDTIVCMDALSLLATLPDCSIDLIATDPPYGIQYQTGHVKYSVNGFGIDNFDGSWITEAYRVLKPDSCVFLCTRWDVLHLWSAALIETGFAVKQRIVWDKGNWSAGDLDYFGSQTEDVLFAIKGRPVMNWHERDSNIWYIPRITRAETRRVVNPALNLIDHPTQKPVALMEKMIRCSTSVGEIVLDPFCGAGTTGQAARQLGRHYLLGDIDPQFVAMSQARLGLPYTPRMEGV